ncbi:MAG: sulfatase-like hydrolase/transferase [Bacteroidales bacterium]|nr:sulfatase-like hydrolase/transferase [Bacteroidales bacterium]
MNLNSIRAFFAKGNRAKWFVFTLFCIVLFIKTMIFHLSTGWGLLISTLWKNPTEFFMFWGGKIVPILFLGAFVFITKKQWWTIVINVLVDLWAIANLFYFKAYNLFLSVEVMLMANNLNGFWDSLYTYIGLDIFSFIILTVVFLVIMLFLKTFNTHQRKPLLFVMFLLLFLIADFSINKLYQKALYKRRNLKTTIDVTHFNRAVGGRFNQLIPFGNVRIYAKYYYLTGKWDSVRYVYKQSIISYLPASIIYYVIRQNFAKEIKISDDDLEKINQFIRNAGDTCSCKPKTNIVFILFESFESWPLSEVKNFDYMPNLNNLIQKKHVLYCDKIVSQTKYGNSADGQMIYVTGLLPISNGATCMLYGNCEFPNFAHLFKSSVIFNPAAGVWNQPVVTKSYQFKKLIEPQNSDDQWRNDDGLIGKMTEYILSADSSFCILGITIDTHCPFTIGSTRPIHVEDGMPSLMSSYLNCLYHTDFCIGNLLDTIINTTLAENTTIVITGDHTIFHTKSAFTELTEYAQENGINFRAGHTFTPLIIYSPEIEGNIHVTDTCYQMDIFPTILNLIGAEDYFWHGFGVNVMDSVARHNRPITEQEAYRLSDLMIRSDYFRNYYNSADSAGNDK